MNYVRRFFKRLLCLHIWGDPIQSMFSRKERIMLRVNGEYGYDKYRLWECKKCGKVIMQDKQTIMNTML